MFKKIFKWIETKIKPQAEMIAEKPTAGGCQVESKITQEIDIIVRRPDGTIKAERHIRK